MNHLIYDPLVQALGSTVLHSLWQATLLAVALWMLSRNRRLDASNRYWLGMGALGSQLAISLLTLWYFYEPVTSNGITEMTVFEWANGATAPLITEFSPTDLGIELNLLDRLYFGLAMVWILGLFFGSLRLLGGHLYVRNRFRKQLQPIPALWEEMALSIAGKMQISGDRLIEKIRLSTRIASPAMIGLLRPLILFPFTIINELEPEEIEALLAHEIAHFAAKDHWWNFLQTCIEILFYCNPAIHWIGKRVREEREFRCDRTVADLGIDPIIYAKSLYRIEEQRLISQQHALAAKPGSLLGRIEHLLRNTPNYYRMKPGLLVFLLLLVGTLFSSRATLPDLLLPTTNESTTLTEANEDGSQILRPRLLSGGSNAEMNVLGAVDTIKPGRQRRIVSRTSSGTESRQLMVISRNGQDIELEKVNGKITNFKIDGRTIPTTEYDQHEDLLSELDNIPAPPAPPAPPVPLSAPPAPPAPPSGLPAPPAPPAPPVRGYNGYKDSQTQEFNFDINEQRMRFNIPGTDSVFNMNFEELSRLKWLKDLDGKLDENGDLLPEYEDEFEENIGDWAKNLFGLREDMEDDDFDMRSLFNMKIQTDEEENSFRFRMSTEDGENEIFDISGDEDIPLNLDWTDEEGNAKSLRLLMEEAGTIIDDEALHFSWPQGMGDTLYNDRGEVIGFVDQNNDRRVTINRRMEELRDGETSLLFGSAGRSKGVHEISGQKFMRLAKDFQRRGLINGGSINNFFISEKKMKVNGKKISGQTFERFVKEYQAKYQVRWEELGEFDINVDK